MLLLHNMAMKRQQCKESLQSHKTNTINKNKGERRETQGIKNESICLIREPVALSLVEKINGAHFSQ